MRCGDKVMRVKFSNSIGHLPWHERVSKQQGMEGGKIKNTALHR